MFERQEIKQKLNDILECIKAEYRLEFLNEVAMKRVVRGGKIVRKVKTKRQGFKVVRQGNKIKFARMTPAERRARRIAAKKAWRKSKASRKSKANRTLRKSKVKIKLLHRRK